MLNRPFTWGLDEEDRRVAETDAATYFEAMAADVGPVRTTIAAIRSMPGWLWDRLSAGRVTTLPAATGLALLAVTSCYVVVLPNGFTSTIRILFAINSLGLFLATAALIRRPRRLVIRDFSLPALLIGIAVIGIALVTRDEAAWSSFPHPPVGSGADLMFRVGLGVLGIGCLIAAVNGFVFNDRRLALSALASATVGFALFGSGIIFWAIGDAPDQWGFATSAAIAGLAALSAVHVLPRLRHLEIE